MYIIIVFFNDNSIIHGNVEAVPSSTYPLFHNFQNVPIVMADLITTLRRNIGLLGFQIPGDIDRSIASFW
jgi:hypothetical protein